MSTNYYNNDNYDTDTRNISGIHISDTLITGKKRSSPIISTKCARTQHFTLKIVSNKRGWFISRFYPETAKEDMQQLLHSLMFSHVDINEIQTRFNTYRSFKIRVGEDCQLF